MTIVATFSGIHVYALIGKSGTGKSFRARLLAEKYNIPYIIDDGLLINGNRIIAGKSAKKEKLYMGAIKTALFDDPQHRLEIRETIKKEKVRKILLIGTSEKMVNKMTQRLGLPPVNKLIKIEDIASREEIEKAIQARYSEGKHIIPVPSIEIKTDYSHILQDSIKILFRRSFGFKKETQIFEKAVVTPEFATEKKRGTVKISEAALGQMILHCIDEYDCEIKVIKISVKKDRRGYRIKIYIEAGYGSQLGGNLHDLQAYVLDKIERFTGILIEEVDIEIARVSKWKKKSNDSLE
ncbi:AAA family ATPase [Oceanispirochaeta crateris]|uniref:AAA family ATPase n=2 Tax=Oceanispirochaeta crateris TaxID=2518645 RepID=A0A5C1QQV1_9SPIO|nr:AAA family ATPase [Oceanispirochaeta crateris]